MLNPVLYREHFVLDTLVTRKQNKIYEPHPGRILGVWAWQERLWNITLRPCMVLSNASYVLINPLSVSRLLQSDVACSGLCHTSEKTKMGTRHSGWSSSAT